MTRTSRRRVVDITIRLRRKDGRRATAKEAKAALWAAHKIAQKSGSATEGLREWVLEAVDWRNTYPSGHTKTFRYTNNLDEVIANMGGILESLGLDGLRVALVNRREQ